MRLGAGLLLVTSSLAQTKPDFSGIFLRTETAVGKQLAPAVPRILQITQTAGEVVATATQNGETAVAHYRFDSKASDTVQARLKGNNLVVNETVQRQRPSGGFVGALSVTENVEETWELSPDGQQLFIRSKSDLGATYSDTYTREPSMDGALAAAATTKTSCHDLTSDWVRKNQPAGKYDGGALLGFVSFAQITRCLRYEAELSGAFFKDLEFDTKAKPVQFRKEGQPISTYTGDVTLEVQPLPNHDCAAYGPWVSTGTRSPELVHNLRFMVRWLGQQEKDLGEVQAEFHYEPWHELNPPTVIYRMRIPAQGIPLTDDLEVLIFSNSGEQLACVKGHI